MGESPRYVESQGSIQSIDSQLHYFSWSELVRGHQRRIVSLAEEVANRKPDLLLLQEVGASGPNDPQGCETFLNAHPQDQARLNTALQLARRLETLGQTYQSVLGCRGNVGWSTDSETFRNRQILRSVAGEYRVVHPRGSNPYPNGVLTEGLAILAAPRIQVLDHKAEHLEINFKRDRFFVHWIAFKLRTNRAPAAPWYIAVNIHGGHKVAHLEQAVATQLALQTYIAGNSRWGRFGGAISAGDFNAQLYRPLTAEAQTRDAFVPADGEIITTGWEPTVPGLYDLSGPSAALDRMKRLLVSLNDSTIKAFATIRDPNEAQRRVGDAVARFNRWVQQSAFSLNQMTERVDAFNRLGTCRARPEVDEACHVPHRIDHVFATPGLRSGRAVIVFPQNDWVRLDTLSDHPGVLVDFLL